MKTLAKWSICLCMTGVLGAQVPVPPPPPPPPPPAVPETPAPFWPERRKEGGPWRVERRVEKLASGAKLWVKNRSGSIKVQGWDQEQVELTADIRDSDRRKVELTTTRKGDGLEIEANFQQPTWSFSFGFVTTPKCDLTLKIPRKAMAYFNTRNGSILLSDLDGFARCETTNGDIRAKEFNGELWADTTNGHIEGRRMKARIKGGTSNGRLMLEDVEGGINLRTSNGTIRARNLEGWGEGIQLSTTNGDITVELGRATGELRAETSGGQIDSRVSTGQVLDKEKRFLRLKIPGRNQSIVLETTNGGIRILP